MAALDYEDNKTYEQLMREALLQIPVYSSEWTNFNGSDPGVTILENLMAFQLVQREQLHTVTKEAREKLLKLAGYEPRRAQCAKVLLQNREEGEPFLLPAGQKLTAGGVCFETRSAVECTGGRVLAVYGESCGGLTDLSAVLLRQLPVDTLLFGREPQAGQKLYFVMDSLPPAGGELILYAQMKEQACRNAAGEKTLVGFAALTWEYYTAQGFAPLDCLDETAAFFISGALRFSMPEQEAAVYDGLPAVGCVIRATLRRADYDIAPRMRKLSGFLFEARQQETGAECLSFRMSTRIDWYGSRPEQGYVRVYCLEKKEEGYRLYREAPAQPQTGRYFRMTAEEKGHYRFYFNKRKYRYGPAGLKNAVRVVAYEENIMRQYHLGTVLGYDRQMIELPVKNIVEGSFCLLAEREDAGGEARYDFLKPQYPGEGALLYTLDAAQGRIVIEEAGDFVGAELYIASVSVSRGEEGNLPAWNEFTPAGEELPWHFTNPCAAKNGRLQETGRELIQRFSRELRKPSVAVSAGDYETLVRETPGLCIHKVKARINAQKNEVEIVVKPYADRPLPELSDAYRKAILKQLSQKRLLTTKISVRGPVYLPIHAAVSVCVKAHYERCPEQIEALLIKELDYSENDREFGARVRFDELFHAIEDLDCVEYVTGLRIRPQNGAHAVLEGQDIRPAEYCLCCPGRITLTVETCAP